MGKGAFLWLIPFLYKSENQLSRKWKTINMYCFKLNKFVKFYDQVFIYLFWKRERAILMFIILIVLYVFSIHIFTLGFTVINLNWFMFVRYVFVFIFIFEYAIFLWRSNCYLCFSMYTEDSCEIARVKFSTFIYS